MSGRVYLNLILAAFSVFIFTACGSKVQFGLSSTGQSFKQNSGIFMNQIDILWVVDNSPSMSPLQNNLTSNFGASIQDFQSRGYDFHIAVTTSDAYLSGAAFHNDPTLAQFKDGTNATSHTGVYVITPQTPNLIQTFQINALQGSTGSGDERVFSSFRNALKDPLNSGFVRQGGFLAVIILSDEDDFSGDARIEYGGADHDYGASTLDPVSDYINILDQVTGSTPTVRRYNVSTIAVLDNTCLQQHLSQSPSTIVGQRYMALSTATKGVMGSICDANFSATLKAISNQIAVLSSQFYLNRIPNPSTLVVTVDGANVPQDSTNGFTYDSSSNSILFHGAAIPPQGANIAVNFAPIEASH